MNRSSRVAVMWMRSINHTLRRAVDTMTSGQRWTTAISLALTSLVLLYGFPAMLEVVDTPRARPAGAASAPASTTARGPVPGPEPAAALAWPSTSPVEAPHDVPSVGTPAPDTSTPLEPVHRIVALVRADASAVPGRDDAAMAHAFLQAAGVTVTTIPFSSDPGLCEKVAAEGDVVIAAEGAPDPLRRCLLQAGLTILGHDPLGDFVLDSGTGQVLSTRRGVADSLLDLARWGARTTLRGRVGIAATDDEKLVLDAVVPLLRDLGVNVVDTAGIDPSDRQDVRAAVMDFAAKGVEVVVFAAPVDIQSEWAVYAAVISPQIRYVVTDAYDGIVNERYPSIFDGAVAYTSVQVPAYSRPNGTTTELQARCLQTWSAVAPPATLPSEFQAVFEWCQLVPLVAGISSTGGDLRALRSVRTASPLTSDVGPLDNDGWGPTQNHTLIWRATCGCWVESEPFQTR